MKVSKRDLRRAFWRKHISPLFISELQRLLDQYGNAAKINTPKRLARFLAQAVHETGIRSDGSIMYRESLNYTPKTLMRISSFFRKHPKLANRYGRTKHHIANQKAIANLMYDDKNRPRRLKLGNKWAGDGYAFRGAGMFQTTGRYNMGKDIEAMRYLFDVDIINPQTKQPYKGILNNDAIFIMLGMAHWWRTKMWKMNTKQIIEKINSGLPKKMKKQRLATANRLMKLFV